MSEPLRFRGLVGDAGELRLDEPGRWRATLIGMRGKRIELALEAERKVRTNPQLRRYFKCIVPVVAAVLSVGRALPLSKEQTHRLLCGAFIGYESTPLGDVPIESKTLTPAQFAAYCDAIEAHFRAEAITFPLLDEAVGVAL